MMNEVCLESPASVMIKTALLYKGCLLCIIFLSKEMSADLLLPDCCLCCLSAALLPAVLLPVCCLFAVCLLTCCHV
jgi:hypothetical protein